MSKEKQKTSEAVFETESFLQENYEFRRNILSGKTEVRPTESSDDKWIILTTEVLNSIILRAKKEEIGDTMVQGIIHQIVTSDTIPEWNPVMHFLENLPAWDQQDHVASLFNRIPGLTSEQLSWCRTWLRSAVAHWMSIDVLHGNESVPVLIGKQGCGKSTFALRLLPPELREYFLDHINFANKFDSDMALTHNLLVNIDEFANMGPTQQGKLKQTLSRVKVNGRPIFGKSQEDRRRFASFLATTNDEHPLCDVTGSRRYLCLQIPHGQFIDNETPIDYFQLYAQIIYEIKEQLMPYWFNNEEVERIQQANLPFFKCDDLESMISCCFRVPLEKEEGRWMLCKEVFEELQNQFPTLISDHSTKVKIGQVLRYMGCASQHSRHGQMYQLINKRA
jgi:predicted P-loop ATPase